MSNGTMDTCKYSSIVQGDRVNPVVNRCVTKCDVTKCDVTKCDVTKCEDCDEAYDCLDECR
jgi:hypothetical protein